MPHQTPVVYHPGQLAGVQILGVLFFRSGYSLKDCHAIDRRGPLHPYKGHAPPETQRATYRQQQSRHNVISPGAHLHPLIIMAWMAARMSMVPPAATRIPLGLILSCHAAIDPDRPALTQDGVTLSRAELEARATTAAPWAVGGTACTNRITASCRFPPPAHRSCARREGGR